MKKPFHTRRCPPVRTLLCLMATLGLMLASVGCKNIINRAQSPDDHLPIGKASNSEEPAHIYIAETCGAWGGNPAPIEGLSLATGLDGTGSNPGPSQQREMLTKTLSARSEIDNSKSLVKSMDSEIVMLRGMLPAGIRKGERYDIEVRTLRDTEGTSIENGIALQARLRPQARLGRAVKQGHVKGLAKGRIIVDSMFSTRDDQSTKLRGFIPGGGIATVDRELGLNLRSETFRPNTTMIIARAINKRFTVIDREGRQGAAEPKTDQVIDLQVPAAYRLNVGRYLTVLANLAYEESSNDRVNRMDQLDRELASPSTCELAALRLEAMGRDGYAALKRAIRNPDLEVRFHAAQALAYQDQADGAEVLKLAALKEPAFRWAALTALATLDSASADAALTELLHVPSAETRYGAFFAMRAKTSQSPLIAGNWIADDYFLHEIESEADPILHFSKTKRPEIVVFNDQQTVSEGFLYIASGLTVRAQDKDTIKITRYRKDGTDVRSSCSTRVGDLVQTLSDNEVRYGELLLMFRKAKDNGTLNSRLVVNAIPTADREYIPGDNDDTVAEMSEKYLSPPTPTLFQDLEPQKTEPVSTTLAELAELPKELSANNGGQKPGGWSKLNPFKRAAE